MFTGFPGVVSRFHTVPSPKDAAFAFTRLELERQERIVQIQSVLASRKLAGVEQRSKVIRLDDGGI